MTSPGHVVGIDGGGTRTRYQLADAAGRVLARSEGRGSLLGAGRDGEIADEMTARVRALAAEAGLSLPLRVLCAGLAGSAGRPEGTRAFERDLLRAGIVEQVKVISDGEVAFEDAFGGGEGILLVAGTGSIAFGRGKGETLERIGGWGALLGDEGSAYRIALDGLRAAIRGSEGRGEPTHLTASIFKALRVDSVREIFEWGQLADKGEVAALAPLVFEAARRDGDSIATVILSESQRAIVSHAVSLRRMLFEDASASRSPIQVALVGGIIEPGGPLRAPLVSALESEGFSVLTTLVDPTRGAVRMALRIQG